MPLISNKVGDPTVAEDLTSTVFLKALRWLREEQSADSARGWLYATARTTIIDYWQAQSLYERRSLSGLEEQLLKSDDTAQASEQVEMRVQRLLSLLPERDRTILTLRYLQGYSAAEIAAALGTSAGHIRVLQLRALRRAAQVETMERSRYRMQEQESPFDSIVKFMAPESRRVLDLAREEMLIPIRVLRDHSKMREVGQRTETLRVGFQLIQSITHLVNHGIKRGKSEIRELFFA